jgi:hypothetical protein
VDHGAVILSFHYVYDCNIVQGAGVVGLSATGGIEGRPIQHNRWAALPLQSLHDVARELYAVWVIVIEPVGHALLLR